MVDEPESEDELSARKKKIAGTSSRFKTNIIKTQ